MSIWCFLFKNKKQRSYTTFGTGCIPSPITGHPQFEAAAAELLPQECPDVGPWKIKNQGPFGSCTAHAVASALEAIAGDKGFPLSERFNWYQSRKAYGCLPQNSGVPISTALAVAESIGLAPESLCPYIDSQLNVDPGVLAKSFARFARAGLAYRCYTVDAMKSALAAGQPVIIGMNVTDSFMRLQSLDIPAPAGENHGGHCIFVSKYDPIGFLLRNSYDTFWGQNGSARLSFDMAKDMTILFEAWTITGEKNSSEA